MRNTMPVLVLGMATVACGNADETRLYTDQRIRALPQELAEQVGPSELSAMEAYVDGIVKPETVSNTVSMGGDQFDCVFVDRQPNIERRRDNGEDVSATLEAIKDDVARLQEKQENSSSGRDELAPGTKSLAPAPVQVSQPVEEVCPIGTVPIRKIPLDEVAAYGTLDNYLTVVNTPPSPAHYNHATADRSGNVYGMRANINLWSPHRRPSTNGDHTIAQMWLYGGSGSSTETVETGWREYGTNNSSRLFAFFTNSNYATGTTNCSTHNCSCYTFQCGFAQTDNTVFFDGVFGNYSTAGGSQYESNFGLVKLYTTDNWHVMYNGKWAGFWDRSYFGSPGLYDTGSYEQWGGEVYDDFSDIQHTTTAMGGDGAFGSTLAYRHTAYERNLEVEVTPPAGSLTFTAATGIGVNNDSHPECYDAGAGTNDPSWGSWVEFGGPGQHGGTCLALTK